MSSIICKFTVWWHRCPVWQQSIFLCHYSFRPADDSSVLMTWQSLRGVCLWSECQYSVLKEPNQSLQPLWKDPQPGHGSLLVCGFELLHHRKWLLLVVEFVVNVPHYCVVSPSEPTDSQKFKVVADPSFQQAQFTGKLYLFVQKRTCNLFPLMCKRRCTKLRTVRTVENTKQYIPSSHCVVCVPLSGYFTFS